MVREKLLKVEELAFDENLYPRLKVSWLTAYQYAQAMKAGAVFPPIVVGELNGKYYLVDGWHRVEARRILGEEFVNAVVKRFESERELFAEAVRLNSSHGKPLSVVEKTRIIHRLEGYGFTREEISRIVGVPVEKISRFEARVVKTASGEPLYVKAVAERAAVKSGGSLLNVVEVDQSKFIGRDVATLLEQLIEMIEGGIYPWQDSQVAELTLKLYTLLKEKLKLREA